MILLIEYKSHGESRSVRAHKMWLESDRDGETLWADQFVKFEDGEYGVVKNCLGSTEFIDELQVRATNGSVKEALAVMKTWAIPDHEIEAMLD